MAASPLAWVAQCEALGDHRARLEAWMLVKQGGSAVPELTGSFQEAVTDPLKALIRRGQNSMVVGREGKAVGRKAARLVVAGLCAGLPAADAAAEGVREGLEGLCHMLREEREWPLLDELAAGPAVPLFAGGDLGLYNLESLARDTGGHWRLPAALQAVAQRCLAAGDLRGGASLFHIAATEGLEVVSRLAHALREALCSAAGSAWLAQLGDSRVHALAASICQHGGAECGAFLLARLQLQPECPSAARRALALAVLGRAGAEQTVALCGSMPGFRAALGSATLELGAAAARGPPAPPASAGWALPQGLVSQLQCDRADPGQLCGVCQPLVDFMSGTAMETIPVLRFEEGEAAATLDHLHSVLGDLARRCPALPKYLQHKAFAADSQHKQRGRRARRQVAAIRCWKVDTWHQDALQAYRAAKQEAARLQGVLAAAPADAAPALPAESAGAQPAAAAAEPEAMAVELSVAAEASSAIPAAPAPAPAAPVAQAPSAAQAASAVVAAEGEASQETQAASQAAAASPVVLEAAPAAAAVEVAAAASPAATLPAAAALPGTGAAMATPQAPAAVAQLLDAEVPAQQQASQAAATPCSARVTVASGSKPALVQLTLARDEPLSQGRRRDSLAPPNASQAGAGGSTAKKRAAEGSTAKKDAGPGSRIRASLRKQATALKLPTLLHWYKPEPASQQLSWEQCQELGGEGVAPVALHFDGEGSQDRDKVVVVAGSVAVGPSKRSRH